MPGIKSLIKDTAVYGLSSIIGRFLNWGLVPLYVYLFDPAVYGVVTYLYSFTAVALVILNYGMETGFFRFASRSDDPEKVYTTSLFSVAFTSLLFILLLSAFLPQISNALLLPQHHDYVWMLGVIVAVDAFTNLPFAYLRYKNRAWTFAGIKFLNIGVNIGLNLFFLLACPRLQSVCPAAINWFYTAPGGFSYGIGWIFVANFISTAVVLAALSPFIIRRWRFDFPLLKKMLSYSWPLLILGVAGIASQNMGTMIIPYLFSGHEEAARSMVGIYGANMKIAIVMVMFTQAFRYAYEPFIFSQARADGQSSRQAYCDAMKYFVIFGLLIFLGVMYFLPILKHFVAPAYWSGLRVVPIMMMADLFFGVFFNLSLWYKLTDRTRWGMYFSLICFALMLGLNCWLVPLIGIPDGYLGSAWAAFFSYFAVMVLSYIVGRYYYPLPYQTGRMALYTLLALALWGAGSAMEYPSMMWLTYLIRAMLLVGYLCVVAFFEEVPVVSRKMRGVWHRVSPARTKVVKPNNMLYALKGWMRQITPRAMFRAERDMLLRDWQQRPDADEIRARVAHYAGTANQGRSIESEPDITDFPDAAELKRLPASSITPRTIHSHYVYDLNRYLRALPGDTVVPILDGDVKANPPFPAITKARRLDAPNAENAVIFDFDSRLLMMEVRDAKPFEKKTPKLVYRGNCTNKPRRTQFISRWQNSPLMDVADTAANSELNAGKGETFSPYMPIERQLDYQFILALEGMDVASNLRWILSSNSALVMPTPTVDSWLLPTQMIPGVHYIEIAADYSDAEEKLRYYIDHPAEAAAIAAAGREWLRRFADTDRERIIMHLLMQKVCGMK